MKNQLNIPANQIENIEDALWLAARIADATNNDLDSKIKPKNEMIPKNTDGHIVDRTSGADSAKRAPGETPVKDKAIREIFDNTPSSFDFSGTVAKTKRNKQNSTLELQRALRPLKEHIPNYAMKQQVDIDATLHRFLEDRLRFSQQEAPSLPELRVALPVMQPAMERLFDIILIIDKWSTMRFFNNKVKAFCNAVEQSGIFRRVYKYDLDCDLDDENIPKIFYDGKFGRQGAVSIKSMINRNSARLIIFISDCISPLWDTWVEPNGIGQLMRELGSYHSLAILQTLPDDLWLRTGLAYCEFGEVTATICASPNSRLESTPRIPNDPDLPIPVLTFEPENIMAWARLVTGKADTTVLSAYIPTSDKVDVELISDQEKVIDNFLASAPTQAQHLAASLAVIPDMPVNEYQRFEDYFVAGADSSVLGELLTRGLISVTDEKIKISTDSDASRKLLGKPISDLKKLEVLRFYYENCLDGSNENFWFFFDNRGAKLENATVPSLPTNYEHLVNLFFPPSDVQSSNERVSHTASSESNLPAHGDSIQHIQADYLNLPIVHISMWGGTGVGKTSFIMSLTRDKLLRSSEEALERLGHYGNTIDTTYPKPQVESTNTLKDYLFIQTNAKTNEKKLICIHDFAGIDTLTLSERIKIIYRRSSALFLCFPADEAGKYKSELFNLLNYIRDTKSLQLGICFTKSEKMLSYPEAVHYLPNLFGAEVMKLMNRFSTKIFWVSSEGKSTSEWKPENTSTPLSWVLGNIKN